MRGKDRLEQLAEEWQTERPHWASRLRKATQLAPETRRFESLFLVPGNGRDHRVNFDARNNRGSCDCNWHRKRNRDRNCSHILAARLAQITGVYR
jgi:hypothetical protein